MSRQLVAAQTAGCDIAAMLSRWLVVWEPSRGRERERDGEIRHEMKQHLITLAFLPWLTGTLAASECVALQTKRFILNVLRWYFLDRVKIKGLWLAAGLISITFSNITSLSLSLSLSCVSSLVLPSPSWLPLPQFSDSLTSSHARPNKPQLKPKLKTEPNMPFSWTVWRCCLKWTVWGCFHWNLGWK